MASGSIVFRSPFSDILAILALLSATLTGVTCQQLNVYSDTSCQSFSYAVNVPSSATLPYCTNILPLFSQSALVANTNGATCMAFFVSTTCQPDNQNNINRVSWEFDCPAEGSPADTGCKSIAASDVGGGANFFTYEHSGLPSGSDPPKMAKSRRFVA